MKHWQWPQLPIAEAVGVLIGVLSWDWLSEGHASILRALALAIPCGVLVYGVRCLNCRKRMQGNDSHPPSAN